MQTEETVVGVAARLRAADATVAALREEMRELEEAVRAAEAAEEAAEAAEDDVA